MSTMKSLRFLSLYYCLSFFATTTSAIGPVADLAIVNSVISPDGYARSAVLAGDTFPGPPITGLKGDRFVLNVVNGLTDGSMAKTTSICPIASGDSFVYDFNVPEQAGTFWYHSHLSTQYCDGLRGAFVVYDPDDPHAGLYDVDDESTIITLADWYHDPSPSLVGPGKLPPESVATLINGQGRYVGGPASPLSVINVIPFTRYRFRIIGMACDPAFTFSIDGHDMTIIEADGQNTIPHIVDSLDIYAGQRYSVVVVANQPIGNYWIRANPNRGSPGFDGGRNLAILRYLGAPASDPTDDPTIPPPSVLPLNEVDLHPLVNPAAPGNPWAGGADVNINLVTTVNFTTFKYQMNGVPFIPPTVPVLLQILSGAQVAQDLLPKGSIYALPPNKVIEISIPGTDVAIGGPHEFSVIRSAGSSDYNFADPIKRDTVNGGFATDNTTIRFVTDNAGPWFFHCHIDWHLELGLAVVFAEDLPEIPVKDAVNQEWRDLCPIYDSLTPEQIGAQ
ncbi:hypothetical protein H0H92_001364 [Tricholoma furcatifolium]|nr:hypothetical protein H0H92_001364 [Tricholoma furcatifolium]